MGDWMREALFLPEAASDVAERVDLLHFFVIGVTMLGSFGVALMVLVFALRYRRTKREPGRWEPKYSAPRWLEFGVIGGLFGLFLMWWGIGVQQYQEIQEPPDDALEVYVVGKQWMWKFEYPGGQRSASTLVVPEDTPVELILTSRDVIHSLFIPAFRVKQDALPNRYTTMWFQADEPGRYDILCAEFCGLGHSTMRGRVEVLTAQEYARWLDGTWREDLRGPDSEFAEGVYARPLESRGVDLVTMGERVAGERGCLRCHTMDGSPHIGPSFGNLFGREIPLRSGETAVVDAAYITRSITDPTAQIHAGFAPVMPSYRGLLSPSETAALVELIRTLEDAPSLDGPSPRPLEPASPLPPPEIPPPYGPETPLEPLFVPAVPSPLQPPPAELRQEVEP